MILQAPAKLNLFLHVLGRRADGYHELQTVFQLVSLCDEVRIEPRDDGRVVRLPPDAGSALAAVPPEQDLTVRAALLLKQRTATPAGASISVRKRIPLGGGLGGGSSDAACVLRALNQLWGTGLDADGLASLGLELGADVPFFVRGRNAWGEGRGERLTPLQTPAAWFLIVHPGIAVSTAGVFSDPELTRDTPPLTMRDLPTARLRNDCEGVVRKRHPEVAAALDHLGPGARLSGTGACVFQTFAEAAEAEAAAARLPAAWTGFVAKGLQQISD